jgi:hypothetical protein
MDTTRARSVPVEKCGLAGMEKGEAPAGTSPSSYRLRWRRVRPGAHLVTTGPRDPNGSPAGKSDA